jgi:hypothetical protein
MVSHLNGLLVFALGSFGALAPEIIRLYELRWKSVKFSCWYLFLSLLYAIVGGVVALILPSVNYYAAFYAGITAPITISTIARKRRPKVKNTPQVSVSDRGSFEQRAADSKVKSFQAVKKIIQDHADGLFL